jgi:CheY-like chemotaxis protein
MKILVADDDDDYVVSKMRLLRRLGYSVVPCTYGPDVMALIEQERPDVVLLDLAMPGMSGFDVALELADNPDLRPKLLIAVTGYGDPEAKDMTARAGFDYHFVKPVKFADFKALLDGLVQVA